MKDRLFTPGPTQIPERVQAVMANAIIHHRGAAFKSILAETIEDLKYFFLTDGDIIILTSSGTGAMEACFVNILRSSDTVLTVSGGKFGERWGHLCKAYGIETHTIEVPWGQAVDPQDILTFLRNHPETAMVCVTHSETSTGVAEDVQTIAEIVRSHSDALFVVDAITSAGVLPFKMDEWGIDVAVTGSQKGLMIPPGLGCVALGKRVWDRVRQSDLPKFYFDFTKEMAALEKSTTAWTPGITLIIGLREALLMIREAGLENLWKKYATLAHATRKGVQAMNLRLFAKTPSDSLTAVRVPHNIDGIKFIRHLREKYGITIAGGQAHLKGKIFRIAHMGYYDALDMVAMASALELALVDFEWNFPHGAGVSEVQNVFMKTQDDRP